MEKYIIDERSGLKYELVGEYCFICDIQSSTTRPFTPSWWQAESWTVIADLNEQAEDMFLRLVKELAEKEGITETLKAKNQMLWVQRMNEVRETATKTVNNDLIYT